MSSSADIFNGIPEVVVKVLVTDKIPDLYRPPFIILGSIRLVAGGHSRSFRVVVS